MKISSATVRQKSTPPATDLWDWILLQQKTRPRQSCVLNDMVERQQLVLLSTRRDLRLNECWLVELTETRHATKLSKPEFPSEISLLTHKQTTAHLLLSLRGFHSLRLPSPEYPPSQVFEDSTARIQNFELLKQLHCQQHITVFVVSKVFREELLIQEKNISNQTNLFNSLEIQEACIRLIFIA